MKANFNQSSLSLNSASVDVGPGHFHTDCTLWGRLVFGNIQERLGSGLGLGLKNTRVRNFHLQQ